MTVADNETSSVIQDRLSRISNIISRIELSVSDGTDPLTVSDRCHLDNAKKQLTKLERNFYSNSEGQNKSVSDDDLAFADSLLGMFTMTAFSDELADLNKAEHGQMSSDDLATLAESIRTFALGIDTEDRHLFSID